MSVVTPQFIRTQIKGMPALPDFSTAAHRIQSDTEAIAIAQHLAHDFKQEAVVRDRERRLPVAEMVRFSTSGLGAITVPSSHGGAGVSWATLAEVIRIISVVDPAIGQIPQNHFGILNVLEQTGSESQKIFFYNAVLGGARLGNAGPERTTKNVLDVGTRITKISGNDNNYLLNGKRFYSTGALFADWIPTKALDESGRSVFVFVARQSPGLSIVDDWSGFGQRTTASGTVIFDQVRVSAQCVVPLEKIVDQANNTGPVSQLIQAAIDVGIARAALEDTVTFLHQKRCTPDDSSLALDTSDPFIVSDIGSLFIRLHAAEALLERAAITLDQMVSPINFEQMAEASVNVAEAKVLTTEIALDASEKLFELVGLETTSAKYNLDRHWRNARVHTLHDPVRWKYFSVGNYYLNEIAPPRHAWS
ncbi:SfnB family sulfur acquisition oxidoreductase [Glaciimonas sp. CA11.2]|uniref:SfnB family sulfur acquisition oxidoreductase n=1 Tax=Glaciimonas sp. CA11.2 TaxID=3048601 RepID=UPI002AB4C261|nr:SfnB family sulfur acquisition oxidoreductase [Glaciimonas sp. CA11.2]MDY7546844.1 SfnB family sulfur acquisition oxidoreductase [Glaciimonas sp. CA11.2]MEB0164772.1 SfnB family sulfur acquisition oxidoreductase [Glaciimonas sp. CA11.2]